MKAVTIVIFFLILINFSCSVNKLDVDKYKSRFQENKKGFDTLVQLLKKQSLRVGYSVKESEMPESIRIILNDLDISDVNLNATQCLGLIDYEFISCWSTKATLYFSKNTCDIKQTMNGYHDKSSEIIEIWGLGDGWIMWIDYDFI